MVNLPRRIMLRLVQDISERSAFGKVWESIDKDTQNSIMHDWEMIVLEEMLIDD